MKMLLPLLALLSLGQVRASGKRNMMEFHLLTCAAHNNNNLAPICPPYSDRCRHSTAVAARHHLPQGVVRRLLYRRGAQGAGQLPPAGGLPRCARPLETGTGTAQDLLFRQVRSVCLLCTRRQEEATHNNDNDHNNNNNYHNGASNTATAG